MMSYDILSRAYKECSFIANKRYLKTFGVGSMSGYEKIKDLAQCVA